MEAEVSGGFLRHFQELPDPRGPNRLHHLTDMLVMALCAIVLPQSELEKLAV